MNNGIESSKEAIDKEKGHTDNLKIIKDDVPIILPLHELGNRILHSPQVREVYYKNLKPQYLTNDHLVVTPNQLKQLLQEFCKTEGIELELVDKLLSNPRKFIKGFIKKDLKAYLKDETTVLDNNIDKCWTTIKDRVKQLNKQSLSKMLKENILVENISKAIIEFLASSEKNSILRKRDLGGSIKSLTIDDVKDKIDKIKLRDSASDLLECKLVDFLKQRSKGFKSSFNRTTLEYGFEFKYESDEYSVVQFLANIKLAHRSLKREMKNIGTWTKKKHSSVTTEYNYKFSKKLFTEDELIEEYIINAKTRNSLVKGLGTYKNIISEHIAKVKVKAINNKDSDVVSILTKIIKEQEYTDGELLSIIEDNNKKKNYNSEAAKSKLKDLLKQGTKVSEEDDQVKYDTEIARQLYNIIKHEQVINYNDFEIARALLNIIKEGTQDIIVDSASLYNIAYLLFGCEVDRNPASLLTNAMFLELIANNYKGYNFEYMPGRDANDNNLEEGLPVAMEWAVKAKRTFNAFFNEYLSTKFFYDSNVESRDFSYMKTFFITQVKGLLGKTQQFIKDDTRNAFNQRNNESYWYQDKDMIFIAKFLIKDFIENNNVYFGIFHNDSSLGRTTLEEGLKSMKLDKPIIGLYNPG